MPAKAAVHGLPWGMAIPELKKDPSLILPILEKLKNDPEEFVRKSVANNLNDISKDNPELVLDICERWHGTSKNTDWIVKHACRTLLKQGKYTCYDVVWICKSRTNGSFKFSITK